MSKKIIGLDVRHEAVTAVMINTGLRENQIEHVLHIPIPDGEDREAGLNTALQSVADQMDTADAACVAAFPSDHISYRNLQVPFKGAKKIGQVLPFELEPTLPYPVEDLIIDFQTVDQSGQGDQTDILAMAVEKEDLETYLNRLGAFAFDPQTVSLGGYSTVQCLSGLEDIPTGWILLELCSRQCTLFLVQSGQICLARSFPLSAENSDKLSRLCADIRRTLTAFEENMSMGFHAERVYLTGPGQSNFGPGLEEKMQTALNLPVVRTDLLQRTNGRIKLVSGVHWQADAMDNALALALSRIDGKNGLNFRKGPFAVRKNWEAHKHHFLKIGIFAGILLLMLLMNVLLETYVTRKKLDSLDRQITRIFKSTFPDVQRIVDPVHQMGIAMDELRKDTFLPGDSETHIRAIDILNEISSLISDKTEVELTRLVIDEDTVLISGDTDTFNAVDEIQNQLEGAALFQKVTISSTNKDKNDNKIRFKMKVDL